MKRLLSNLTLILLFPFGAAAQQPAPKVIEWSRENPNCFAFIVQAKAVRGCVNDDGVAVSHVWAETSSKFIEQDVMVDNRSATMFTFLTDNVTLNFTNKGTPIDVAPSDPQKIARDLMKRGRWGSLLAAFGAGMATRTTLASDSQGNTITIQQPDYAAQARAQAATAERRNRNANDAARIVDRALLSNTLLPGRSIIGALYFQIPKNFTSFDRVVISVAGTRFEFPIPKAEPKK